MNASTPPGSNDDIVNGLVLGHAYSITKFLDAGGHKLIKLQNPWHKVYRHCCCKSPICVSLCRVNGRVHSATTLLVGLLS